MLAVTDTNDPLLKRPFSVLDYEDGNIKILCRIKGRGTMMISEYEPGSGLDVLGPLGNSYPTPPRGKKPLVLAGGTGVASVYPLIKYLGKTARVFYGAKTERDLVLIDGLKEHSGDLHICTDDGSCGEKGNTVEALRKFLSGKKGASYVLYACGPKAMMRAAASFALEAGMQGYASLEERMACGFGVCQGCVAETVRGYERVCREGPIFKMKDVIW